MCTGSRSDRDRSTIPQTSRLRIGCARRGAFAIAHRGADRNPLPSVSCHAAAVPDGRRDRYADAVRARRAELRARRGPLLGGHRAELRACLAAGRLTVSAELSTAGIRRVAAARNVPVVEQWPPGAVAAVLLRRPVPIPLPSPEPPQPIRTTLAGTWRTVPVSAAALPAAGLPAFGGRAVLPLAIGVGLALLAWAVAAQRVAADRARLRRWAAEAVSTVRTAVDTELARRALELERVAGGALDEAVAGRRAVLDAELQALPPDARVSMRADDGVPRPAAVPDDATGADVRPGVDTDGDGRVDTLVTAEGVDLLVHTDLDGDGLADRVLHIGPDASVRVVPDPLGEEPEEVWAWLFGPPTGGA